MIVCYIEIDGSDTDWFDGAVEFLALPPIGSRVTVIDRNANRRHVRVRDLVMGGVTLWSKAESLLPSTPHVTIRGVEEF